MVKAISKEYAPDDPIFNSGPQMFAPASRPSTETSKRSTGGVDPMQEAVDAIEAFGKAFESQRSGKTSG